MSEAPEEEFPSSEASPDLASNEALQQQLNELQQSVKKLEAELKPPTTLCVIYSIVWFLVLVAFPIFLMRYAVPNMMTIWEGMGITLPGFTQLFLKISATILKFSIIILPLWLLLCLVFAYFIGFKERFISRPLCMIIDVLSILLYGGLLLGVFIAMFLPLF
jgi:type II secretory pathway component PulF